MGNEIRTSAVTYWFRGAYQQPRQNRRRLKKSVGNKKDQNKTRQKPQPGQVNTLIKIDEYA